MEKLLLIFTFMCLLGGTCCMAEDGTLSKKALKSCKKVCRQLKQEGWVVFDKEQPVDEAMKEYFLQLEAAGDNVLQMIGKGRDKDISKAYSQARHRISVARAKREHTNAETFTELFESSSSGSSAVYERVTHAEQTVTSLAPVVSLCRTLKDGTTEIHLFYLVEK